MSKKKKKATSESLIHLENLQVKSLEKAKLLCSLLDTMEKEFGIHSVRISFKNNFLCPDVDYTALTKSDDPMERLIGGMMIQLNKNKYGKKYDGTGRPKHWGA